MWEVAGRRKVPIRALRGNFFVRFSTCCGAAGTRFSGFAARARLGCGIVAVSGGLWSGTGPAAVRSGGRRGSGVIWCSYSSWSGRGSTWMTTGSACRRYSRGTSRADGVPGGARSARVQRIRGESSSGHSLLVRRERSSGIGDSDRRGKEVREGRPHARAHPHPPRHRNRGGYSYCFRPAQSTQPSGQKTVMNFRGWGEHLSLTAPHERGRTGCPRRRWVRQVTKHRFRIFAALAMRSV